MNKIELNNLLEKQQAAFKKSSPDIKTRLDNLKKLSDVVDTNHP